MTRPADTTAGGSEPRSGGETLDLITCRVCEKRLSRPVRLLTELPERRRKDADGYGYHPTVDCGTYAVDPAPSTAQTGTPTAPGRHLVVNPLDAQGLTAHPDGSRQEGCCRHDGAGGPNRLCPRCGAEVATLTDDCWTAVEVRFEPDAVRTVRFYG